jgi:outer membrane protein OmpA-like peptidoglycan-associated protein
MKRFLTPLYILILCSINTGVAQKTQMEMRADRAFDIFNYSDAIHFYTGSAALSPESARNLSFAYFRTNQFQKCVEVFEEKCNIEELTSDEHYLYIQALKSAGQAEKAMQQLKTFAHKYPADQRSLSFIANQVEFPTIQANNPDVQVRNLDMNTNEDDFGPAYMNNQIVYASTQKKYLVIKRDYLWNQRNYLNLFAADQKNGQLVNAKQFPFKQNKKWHEADACFFNAGNSMAFTQDSYKERATDKSVNLKIFFSDKVNGKWSKPIPFSLNNKEYSVGHPSISEDGKTMYFASNKPGGYGGTDLYRVDKQADGSWGKPVNLGPSINTEGNELFPFWQETDNSLYFASTGHLGLGGLDLYASEYYGGDAYEPAFNLGAPINSEFDDFSLVLQSNRTDGFFTSNRPSGKGGDDIYAYFNTKPEKPKTVVDLLVLDRQTKKPIPNASARLKDIDKATDANGHVQFQLNDGRYAISVQAVAYSPSSERKLTCKANRRGQTMVKDTFWLDVVVAQKVIINNIFYDFDKWDILPVSAIELDKVAELLKTHDNMRIELGSHTDSRGSVMYNQKLSQQRAESAKLYLIDKGIDASRITAVGYGESQLLNSNPDCTTEQHRQNRRTEIYIPDYARGENLPQTVGDYLDGKPDHDTNKRSLKTDGSIIKIVLGR